MKTAPAPITVALDSGAFTWYTKKGAPRKAASGSVLVGRAGVDHAYSSTLEFQRYFEAYCQFVKDQGHLFAFCTSLDVFLNPARSFELYSEMLRQGLKVLPVYHYGEGPEMLKRYLETADYVGLGGLVKADRAGRTQFLHRAWPLLLKKNGEPKVRVHIFGVSMLDTLSRYPYASADAVTPLRYGVVGRVFVPRIVGSTWDYMGRMYFVCSDDKRSTRKREHVLHMSPLEQEAIAHYVDNDLKGLDLSTSAGRTAANMLFFQRAMAQRNAVSGATPCRFYVSGGPEKPAFDWLGRKAERDNLGFLGTFYDLRPTQVHVSGLLFAAQQRRGKA